MSNMTLNQAADEVRKILRGFKAVEQVADALEQAGSIEAARKDAEKKLAELRGLIVESEQKLSTANAEVESAKDAVKQVVADANAKAKDKVGKAEAKAAEIIADAQVTVAELQAKAQNAKAELDATIADTVVANKELADIERKIAKAKSDIAKLIA